MERLIVELFDPRLVPGLDVVLRRARSEFLQEGLVCFPELSRSRFVRAALEKLEIEVMKVNSDGKLQLPDQSSNSSIAATVGLAELTGISLQPC